MASTPRKPTATRKRGAHQEPASTRKRGSSAKPVVPKHGPGRKAATSKRTPARKPKSPGTRRAATLAIKPLATREMLAQRETELARINSIQRGLAAKPDFQAIVTLVGDTQRGGLRPRAPSAPWRGAGLWHVPWRA